MVCFSEKKSIRFCRLLHETIATRGEGETKKRVGENNATVE